MFRTSIATGLALLALAIGRPLAGSHSSPGLPSSRPHGALMAVAADDALVQRGKVLYAANCAVCHGDAAQGKIGPRIVGKTKADIDQALAMVAMMSSLSTKISPADREAIAAFLQSIG